MRFDNHTAVIVGALAALSISLLSALLLRSRHTYAGFERWTAGNFCAATSLIFLSFRVVRFRIWRAWQGLTLAHSLLGFCC